VVYGTERHIIAFTRNRQCTLYLVRLIQSTSLPCPATHAQIPSGRFSSTMLCMQLKSSCVLVCFTHSCRLRLVHDVLLDEDSSTTSKSDGDEELACCSPTTSTGSEPHRLSRDQEDDATATTETRSRHPSSGRGTPGSGICLPLRSEEHGDSGAEAHLSNWVDKHRPGPGERRRRKLPEIPKNKKCKSDSRQNVHVSVRLVALPIGATSMATTLKVFSFCL